MGGEGEGEGGEGEGEGGEEWRKGVAGEGRPGKSNQSQSSKMYPTRDS